MHGKRFISAFLRLWLVAMVLAVLSCRKEAVSEENRTDSHPALDATSEVTVEFNILDPDALPTTKVDTPSDWGKDDGSEAERKINNIYLFAVDYDTETGTETVEEVVKVDLVPGDFTANGVRTGHTFNLASGIKRFYVGANMTEEHVQAFCNKEVMRADSYASALAMVMDNYESKNGEGTNILMFSAPAKENSTSKTDIDITSTRFLSITAELNRLVSKVMVVGNYKDKDDKPQTAPLTDSPNRTGDEIWYIQTKEGFFFDFQVVLNNTNRVLNIAEKYSDGSSLFNIDPNWNLSDMVMTDGDLIRYKDMFDVTENFTTWDGDQLKERLESTSDWWCSDVPSNRSVYLGKGLYCLENTVFDDYSLNDADKIEAAYLATTHLYIKARFAPNVVYGTSTDEANSNSTPVKIGNMSWCNDRNGKNPYTFYVDGSSPQKYYTSAGVTNWIEGSTDDEKFSKVTEYTGGWVYFRTFFEEGGQDNNDNQITYDGVNYWGIRRNDYCILTINDITNWGDASPGEAFIKVKAETHPWVKRGSSDITVTPE